MRCPSRRYAKRRVECANRSGATWARAARHAAATILIGDFATIYGLRKAVNDSRKL